MEMKSSRRSFLKFGTGAFGALALTSPFTKATAATCHLTPAQTAGPFYPGEKQFLHQGNDLTQIPGHTVRAEGQIVYIAGKVVDKACKPVKNANVEIWQACASGKYNNVNDPNPAALDPHFKYWGEMNTNEKGEYIFKTIIPGAYPADINWDRPPHIHFKVSRLGYKDLITQMYFKGQELNEKDLILKDLAEPDQESVIVDFQPAPLDMEPGALIGSFDITLRSVGN